MGEGRWFGRGTMHEEVTFHTKDNDGQYKPVIKESIR
jgi:hypothetical protein